MDMHMIDINRYNANNINDKHINDIIDDITSNGFSASVEFVNESETSTLFTTELPTGILIIKINKT